MTTERISKSKAPGGGTEIKSNEALVVGGGVAGMTAAIDIANQGFKVTLLDKSPSIGGVMAQIDKTFPTLDCSACILTPKLSEVSRHPNIAGMKDTSAGNMSSYLSVCGDDFDVLSGTISTLFTAMALGASGGVVSLANAFPNICCDLFNKLQSADLQKARRLHYLLYNLNRSVSGSFGVAGVKYAMDVAGYYGGNPRLPLLPLIEQGQLSIHDAIKKAGLLDTQ